MRKHVMVLISILLVLTVVLSACGSNSNNKESSSNKSGGASDGEKKTISISIGEDDYGARMSNYYAAIDALNAELASQGKNVEVVAEILPKVGDDELILQAQAGQRRDISMNSSIDIGWELDAGLIQSIDWLKDSEVFSTLPQNLWDVMTYQGHVYGAIQDMDASPLYINKKALQALGWSEGDINGLADRVLKGDFIMDDVLTIAAEAVQKKITKYGLTCDGLDNVCIQVINNQIMGHEPYDIDKNKTIVNEQGLKATFDFWKKGIESGAIIKDYTAYEDVIFDYFYKGEAMFYIGGTGSYSKFRGASGLSDEEFEKWFYDNVTFTLVPAGTKGGKPGSLANPRLYYVSVQVDDEKMPYVQRIIELAMAPNLQIDHTTLTGKLPVTKDAQEDERFKKMKFHNDVAYMLDYTGVRPPHLGYPNYRDMYKTSIETILVKGSSSKEAYDMFINNYKSSVEDSEVIYQ